MGIDLQRPSVQRHRPEQDQPVAMPLGTAQVLSTLTVGSSPQACLRPSLARRPKTLLKSRRHTASGDLNRIQSATALPFCPPLLCWQAPPELGHHDMATSHAKLDPA